MTATNEHSRRRGGESEFQRALDAIRTDQTLGNVVRELEAVAGMTGDPILKIHIDEVLRALRSRLLLQLHSRVIQIPLGLGPYEGLAAYCARRLTGGEEAAA